MYLFSTHSHSLFIDKSLYSTWSYEFCIIFLNHTVYIKRMRPHKNILGAMHTLSNRYKPSPFREAAILLTGYKVTNTAEKVTHI